MTVKRGNSLSDLFTLAARVKYHQAAYQTYAFLSGICSAVYIVRQKDYIGLWSRETAMKAHTHRRQVLDLLELDRPVPHAPGAQTEAAESYVFSSQQELKAFFAKRAEEKRLREQYHVPPKDSEKEPS